MFLTGHNAGPQNAVQEGHRECQLQRACPGQVEEAEGLLEEGDVHRDLGEKRVILIIFEPLQLFDIFDVPGLPRRYLFREEG